MRSSRLFSLTSLTLITTLILNDIVTIYCRMSGLYVDNGLDQTIIHRLATQREKREVEHEILNLLGLPDRPRNLAGHPPQVKRSAPKFLLDIYRNTIGEGIESSNESIVNHNYNDDFNQFSKNTEGFHISGQDLRAIDQSDVIMSFAAHSESSKLS